jgi:hypothetical protein
VFIIAGVRSTFPNGDDIPPLTPAGTCRCRVYYLRFALNLSDPDHVARLIRPYNARIIDPFDWLDFRNDFEELYGEIRGGY